MKMIKTEMVALQFNSELEKVWPEMHVCWPWQNAIDIFVGKDPFQHPSLVHKDPNSIYRHVIGYIMEKRTFVSHEKSLLDE